MSSSKIDVMGILKSSYEVIQIGQFPFPIQQSLLGLLDTRKTNLSIVYQG
jgi:hypothetical protein